MKVCNFATAFIGSTTVTDMHQNILKVATSGVILEIRLKELGGHKMP